MAKRVDVILCGVGRMGRNHLRVLKDSQQFSLRAVVDPVLAQAGADVGGIPCFASVDQVPDRDFRAAVVATPTEGHHAIAKVLLGRGKDLLMEKPLAVTVDECNDIRDLAAKKSCKVAIGHVERFNPVVRKVGDVLKSGFLGTPIHFSFTRVGGWPESVKDGSNVLVDLAVHDLDILQMLAGEVHMVSAVSHDTMRKGVFDTAEMLLKTGSGASASIHVNWITPTKIRSLRVTGSQGVLFADLILQTCTVHGGNLLRRGPEPRIVDFAALAEDYRNSDRVEFNVRKEEPLRGQLDAFFHFLHGESTAICEIPEATLSVRLAQEALARGRGEA
jgi:UDP-N-acetylglucosamine 3-dehydrogenase